MSDDCGSDSEGDFHEEIFYFFFEKGSHMRWESGDEWMGTKISKKCIFQTINLNH
jgi:hypothetical protein